MASAGPRASLADAFGVRWAATSRIAHSCGFERTGLRRPLGLLLLQAVREGAEIELEVEHAIALVLRLGSATIVLASRSLAGPALGAAVATIATIATISTISPVATLTAPIIQIRTIDRDGTIGYGAATPVKKGMRTATVAYGYADGIFRNAKLSAWAGDIECPMLGRVSMDMTCYDVTQVPESQLKTLERLTLIDDRQPVDKAAEICNTIGYEIFTRLGNRIQRVYV